MYWLGIDLGTSFVKVSVVDAETRRSVYSGQYPEKEMAIHVPLKGWAEQDPEYWWACIQHGILQANQSGKYSPKEIGSIGIAYQMHGLVLIDKYHQVIRPAIIWCDNRAQDVGAKAFDELGRDYCLTHLLNSPGNFTASKLAWIKANEPVNFERIHQVLLPGDFVSLRLTHSATTTSSALSEGVFWDFKNHEISKKLIRYFGFPDTFFPPIHSVFSEHGNVEAKVADKLNLRPGIPVAYKAGDQLNNAFSVNASKPGEAAATAGTSGVLYQVSEIPLTDPKSRINTFSHISSTAEIPSYGQLLCINGTGIMNSWLRKVMGHRLAYPEMNALASQVPAGSEGLMVFPFGNGAERLLENETFGASIHNIDFNVHTQAHLFRAGQEGIAFAFRLGLEILNSIDTPVKQIKAFQSNLFLSPIFTNAFTELMGVPVTLVSGDAASGAARGAGVGSASLRYEELDNFSEGVIQEIFPGQEGYENFYQEWKTVLMTRTIDV